MRAAAVRIGSKLVAASAPAGEGLGRERLAGQQEVEGGLVRTGIGQLLCSRHVGDRGRRVKRRAARDVAGVRAGRRPYRRSSPAEGVKAGVGLAQAQGLRPSGRGRRMARARQAPPARHGRRRAHRPRNSRPRAPGRAGRRRARRPPASLARVICAEGLGGGQHPAPADRRPPASKPQATMITSGRKRCSAGSTSRSIAHQIALVAGAGRQRDVEVGALSRRPVPRTSNPPVSIG